MSARPRVRDSGLVIVRSFEPDAARQVAALLVLLGRATATATAKNGGDEPEPGRRVAEGAAVEGGGDA